MEPLPGLVSKQGVIEMGSPNGADAWGGDHSLCEIFSELENEDRLVFERRVSK